MRNRIAKTVSIALALVLMLTGIVGCSAGVSQSEYDEVVAGRDAARAEVTKLESDLAAAQTEAAGLRKDLAAKGEKPTATPPPAPKEEPKP